MGVARRTDYQLAWCINVLYLFIHLSSMTVIERVTSVQLPPVYWNSTNPIFDRNNEDHIFHVNFKDTIEFVCPQYKPGTCNSNECEYYNINMVSSKEFEDCTIFDKRYVREILNCNQPTEDWSYRLVIEPYSPIPSMLDFKPGCDYYFITTSSGKETGLGNQYLGACDAHNMKIIVKMNGKNTTACPNSPITRKDPTEDKTTKTIRHTTKSTIRPPRPRHTSTSTKSTEAKPPVPVTHVKKTTQRHHPPAVIRTRDKMPKLIRPGSQINSGLINATSSTHTHAFTLPVLLLMLFLTLTTLCR